MVRSPSSSDDAPTRCGLGVDARNRQLRLRLAVTDAAAIALLRLVLEDNDLLALALPLHVCGNRRALEIRSADLRVTNAADEQNLVDRNVAALIGQELLDNDPIANAHAILLAAGLDDRVALWLRRGCCGCCIRHFSLAVLFTRCRMHTHTEPGARAPATFDCSTSRRVFGGTWSRCAGLSAFGDAQHCLRHPHACSVDHNPFMDHRSSPGGH